MLDDGIKYAPTQGEFFFGQAVCGQQLCNSSNPQLATTCNSADYLLVYQCACVNAAPGDPTCREQMLLDNLQLVLPQISLAPLGAPFSAAVSGGRWGTVTRVLPSQTLFLSFDLESLLTSPHDFARWNDYGLPPFGRGVAVFKPLV